MIYLQRALLFVPTKSLYLANFQLMHIENLDLIWAITVICQKSIRLNSYLCVCYFINNLIFFFKIKMETYSLTAFLSLEWRLLLLIWNLIVCSKSYFINKIHQNQHITWINRIFPIKPIQCVFLTYSTLYPWPYFLSQVYLKFDSLQQIIFIYKIRLFSFFQFFFSWISINYQIDNKGNHRMK